MGNKAVIELQYLPSIPYIASWLHFDEVILESKESFIKQTYRNRCRILAANGTESLIVPVQKANHFPIQEIRIDNSQQWAKNHWCSIQSAYGKSPFFEFYAETVKKILLKGHRFLFDLNINMLHMLFENLKIDINIIYSDSFRKQYDSKITDLRSEIHPKKTSSNLGFYNSVVYIQTFGQKFVKDLSAIDLLFNEGPNAKNVIIESIL